MFDQRASSRLLGACAAACALSGCATVAQPWGDAARQADALQARLAPLSPFDPAAVRAEPALAAIRIEAERLEAGRAGGRGPLQPVADAAALSAGEAQALAPLQTVELGVVEAWAVALGRFEDRTLAQALWAELGPLVASIAGPAQPRFATGAGGVTLLAGPFTREGAREVCTQLAALGIACEPQRGGAAA